MLKFSGIHRGTLAETPGSESCTACGVPSASAARNESAGSGSNTLVSARFPVASFTGAAVESGVSSETRRRLSVPPPASPDAESPSPTPSRQPGHFVPPLLQVGLAFIGGAAGGVVGGGAIALDVLIAFSGAPFWVKSLAALGVTASAVAVFFGVLWYVQAMLKRGPGWERAPGTMRGAPIDQRSRQVW